MLPDLFALLVEETGDRRLMQVLQSHTAGKVMSAKMCREMLLRSRDFASREQCRSALRRLAERHRRQAEPHLTHGAGIRGLPVQWAWI